MTNVIRVKGDIKQQRKVSDMIIGETGYTVPWAYDPETELLNERASLRKYPGGTVSMKVKRLNTGYMIEVPKNYVF